MSTFEYLSVLISVVVGLAVAHVLQGVSRFVTRSEPQKLYWIHSVWVVQSLAYLFYFWWFQLGYRSVDQWSSALFVFILLYAIALYLQCAIVVPDEPKADYEIYFFSRRRWFFGTLMLVGLVDAADTLLKPAAPSTPGPVTLAIFLAVNLTLFGVAMHTTKRWYHGLVAIIWLLNTMANLLLLPERGG